MKYRKKPVVVDAEQYLAGKPYPTGVQPPHVRAEAKEPYVVTAHGQRVYVTDGDWIIAEPDGRGYYPCKPDIFEATYELVECK